MPVQTTKPDLALLLNRLKASTSADIRVSLPARVEKYDAATQLVSVQPLLRDSVEQEDGSFSEDTLPIITNVPVIFPGGGGMRITFPIQAGDTVLLVFSDRALDAWQTYGALGTPSDLRRHHLADAVAIPGLHSNASPWNADPSVVTLGSDTGTDDFAALASQVLTALQDIATKFNAHTHPVATAGTALAQTGTAAMTSTPITPPASVGSSTVKIKG